MNETELLLAFQCCNEPKLEHRHCCDCPLFNESECHTKLCEFAIDLILRNRARTERLSQDVNHLQTTLEYLNEHLRSD